LRLFVSLFRSCRMSAFSIYDSHRHFSQ
jgi:hypothetical protein